MKEKQMADVVSVSRREFCKKAVKRTTIAAAATAVVVYEKPALKSFFGTRDAYAANTPGRLTLHGGCD